MITFKAGTRAIAEEVNANFNEVTTNIENTKTELQTNLDTQVTSIQGDVTNLQENKADIDLNNCTRPYVESRTAVGGGGIVEIWSDGYCVQGGKIQIAASSSGTVKLTQPYKDAMYVITNGLENIGNTTGRENPITISSVKVDSFLLSHKAGSSMYCNWRTEGYIR